MRSKRGRATLHGGRVFWAGAATVGSAQLLLESLGRFTQILSVSEKLGNHPSARRLELFHTKHRIWLIP